MSTVYFAQNFHETMLPISPEFVNNKSPGNRKDEAAWSMILESPTKSSRLTCAKCVPAYQSSDDNLFSNFCSQIKAKLTIRGTRVHQTLCQHCLMNDASLLIKPGFSWCIKGMNCLPGFFKIRNFKRHNWMASCQVSLSLVFLFLWAAAPGKR